MMHFKVGDIICFHSWKEYYGNNFSKIGKVLAICAFYYIDDNRQLLKMENNLDSPIESLKSATILINYGNDYCEAVHYENVIRTANTQEIFAWEMSN